MDNYLVICLYLLVGTIIIVFACAWGGKAFTKFGGSERFWFFVIFIFSIYALLFVVVVPKYREKLTTNELFIAIGFIVAFLVWFLPIAIFA